MKREEWERYRRRARHTLASARGDRAQGVFDWACFKAHQAAARSVKGYVRATVHYATGHSVVRLLAAVGEAVPASLLDCAKALDKVCIPARYPDAFDAGAPLDYYSAADAAACIDCAGRILDGFDALAAR